MVPNSSHDRRSEGSQSWRFRVPTFAVAAALAQPQLRVEQQFVLQCRTYLLVEWCTHVIEPLASPLLLERGSVLLIGGDLCYPEPQPESWLKFEQPFAFSLAVANETVALHAANARNEPMVDWLAFARSKTLWLEMLTQITGGRYTVNHAVPTLSFDDQQAPIQISHNGAARPSMLLISGNHDALDNFHEFNMNIIEEDDVGAWLLPQSRPYFALDISASVLVLGFHDTVGSDIDRAQLNYFTVALSRSNATDVVLVFHQPFFLVGHTSYRGRRLRKLVADIVARRKRIVLLLFGDFHFEATYAPLSPLDPFIVICGGGGAFAETTAHLPTTVELDLGTGRTIKARLRDEPFPTSSDWRLWMLVAHFLHFVHPTVFAFGIAFTALASLVLRLLDGSRGQVSQRSLARASPPPMVSTSGVTSGFILNLFVGFVVLVAALTGLDTHAIASTIGAGLLVFLFSVFGE